VRSGIRTLGIVVAAVGLLVCLVSSAAAQTYTVTRNDDPNPAPCEPGNCSLRGAVMAANGSTTVDDVVLLPASASPYLLQYEFLPFQINDETEVRGAGANQTVVKGDGLETIFGIGAGVKATLSGLTITGGTSAIQNNGELLVRGVGIEGNKWNGGTAGIISNGPLTVDSSFLGFNRTEAASGGAIHSNAAVTIVNSTLAQNISKEGPGAISTSAGIPVTILNSAVVSNRSELGSVAAVGGTPLTLRNNIFADNRDATGLQNCTSAGGLTSLGGNVSDDATCGAGGSDKPNVNPLLGPLEPHGGTTPVYSLLAGSPAIDARSDCPAVDQRGVARPQGSACDSGPYEFVPAASAPPPPADTELAMRVGKGKLRMNGKGRIRLRLTCPATEASPPCRGRVAVWPKKKGWPLDLRLPPRLLVRKAADREFSIPAGRTEVVVARLPRGLAARLAERWAPRKVRLAVAATDAAGNRQAIRQFRTLAQARRG
jgi:hypothetical protein